MAIWYSNEPVQDIRGGQPSPIRVQPLNGKKFTLKELQTLVQGLIQYVYIADGEAICVNEEGKFNASWHVNIPMTKLAQGFLFEGDMIVGPAVHLSADEMKQDTTDEPATPSSETERPDTK